MKINSNYKKSLSRRQILPFLGLGLLIPIFGFKDNIDNIESEDANNYQTLLKPDGTTVKVKVSTLNKAKIIKKNVSNNSFFSWLDKKI